MPCGAAIKTKTKKQQKTATKIGCQGFPRGTVVKNLPANAGPGPGRSHMPQSN